MSASFATQYKALFSWRPNLIGQFVFSTLLSLLPLSLVVILFLNTLNKQLAVTQKIVTDNYQVTKKFNSLKQDLNSLERATRQNWVLNSESLDTLIEDKWQISLNSVNQLISLSPTTDYVRQWQQLDQVLQFAYQHVFINQQQSAELFAPISQLMLEQTIWLREQNEIRISKNQQQLTSLQSAFINWLVALIPLTLVVGGGFLWRISGRLKELTHVIGKLGQGHWQQTISVQGSAELVDLGNKLTWVQDQLHMLEQQKDTFLRHVTHELKTPLASIIEGTDLLTDEIVGPLNQEQQAVLVLISQSMTRLRTMIESLLNYNAIRTSTQSVSEFDVEQLIAKINHHFEPRLQARQQLLNWQVGGMPKCAVFIALELVEMILIQLISNALKFSAEGETVTVVLAVKNQQLYLTVSDVGIGINEHEKAHIFAAFYQGKNSKHMVTQGSGLGLSIVKEAVTQLQGELTVLDNKPQGSQFNIIIPITSEQGTN
ncbi:sensor histidine kinase [Pseudoalteromonas mariniglutinosa]|uniref:sensor histidine kinase n=1 Tax=Pseudoalteromonas mariniglutinosa TaxID=206042 RepID=UPI003850E20F